VLHVAAGARWKCFVISQALQGAGLAAIEQDGQATPTIVSLQPPAQLFAGSQHAWKSSFAAHELHDAPFTNVTLGSGW